MPPPPDQPSAPNVRGLVFVFGFTVLLSAALLFLIQLIFARMILPLLGGAAAVWNTSMVFYQAVLLAAYGYGHLISTRLKLRAQAAVHGVVLLLPLLVLPPAIVSGWAPPSGSDPTLWVLGILAAGAGLPFFAVATTSPLLQKWFACTRHPRAGDPYFLYAASNAGSLTGLLGYPFVIERSTTLGQQAGGWAIGYGVVIAATGFAAWMALRNAAPAVEDRGALRTGKIPALPGKRRAKWIVLAAIPSSLMLSVTTYISSDIAAVPLLWVLPLALYLLTFIFAFSRKRAGDEESTRRIAPLLLLAVSIAIAAGFNSPLAVMTALHLMAFFVLAFVCHRRAAQDRPAPEHLTTFYFCLSLGGLLGGMFNTLLAPYLFSGTLEYPLMLIAAAFIVAPPVQNAGGTQKRWQTLKLPALLALSSVLLWVTLSKFHESPPVRLLTAVLSALAALFLLRRKGGFAIGTAALLLPAYFVTPGRDKLLHAERSYFGIHRVYQRQSGHRWLIHGTTLHGVQSTEPEKSRFPMGYYHPAGPVGAIFGTFRSSLDGPIAIAGLGAGGIAAYGKPMQEMTFFEIDPVVKRIASNPEYFTFLRDSSAKVNVVLGDARLSLKAVPDVHYQMIILDAYSSDAIPVHLLTREAIRLYLSKLRSDGLLVFHLSNLHFNLRPLVAALANDAGLVCLFGEDPGPDEPDPTGEKTSSRWAVAARDESTLAPLVKTGNWTRESTDRVRVWTDDYSSPVELLNWGQSR